MNQKRQPLAELLKAQMEKDELTLGELAHQLGIGRSYLSQLLRGYKRTTAASDNFLRASARYLGIPPVTAQLLAGKLSAQDFFAAPPCEWEACIDCALYLVSRSRFATNAAVTPGLLAVVPLPIKLLLIQLFENATGTVLLPTRLGAADLANFGNSDVPLPVRTHIQDK